MNVMFTRMLNDCRCQRACLPTDAAKPALSLSTLQVNYKLHLNPCAIERHQPSDLEPAQFARRHLIFSQGNYLDPHIREHSAHCRTTSSNDQAEDDNQHRADLTGVQKYKRLPPLYNCRCPLVHYLVGPIRSPMIVVPHERG